MPKLISASKQLDVAIAVAETLGIDPDEDENLWGLLDHVDIEAICEQFEKEIFGGV